MRRRYRKVRDRAMNDTFTSWLASGDAGPCCFQDKGYAYILIRVEKNADFEYLFCQRQYNKEGLVRDSTFKYAGIYCRKDGLIYDAEHDLTSLEENPELLQKRSAEELREQLKVAVREKVEAAIGNDRRNLQIAELTDSRLLNQLEYTNKYSAKEAARRHYLDTVDFEPPVFSCHYDPDRWKEDSLLACIADPEGYARQQAEGFIADNQENMLYDFLYNDAVLKEYRAILADTGNPVHIIKKIKAAMETTSAKTVNVTIRKEGTEFTFKTEASSLRGDCGSHYNSWSIVAADRRKFEQLFGRSADYTPEEILCITYARNVLYEAGK